MPEVDEDKERSRLDALALRVERGDKGTAPAGPKGWFRQPVDPLTSLVLVTPVFLVYHLGILVIPLRNGVDLVTNLMISLLRLSLPGYVFLTLALGAGMLLAGRTLHKRGRVHVFSFGRVMLESTLLAVLMLFTVGLATSSLVPNQVGGTMGGYRMGVVDKLVMAAGAGFHEELVFRVGLFGGLTWLFRKRPRLSTWRAPLLAAVLAAVAFSAVHYVGTLGDSFTLTSFIFRFLSGIYLTLVYRYRGFAVAVYTHAIYDLGIFFVAT